MGIYDIKTSLSNWLRELTLNIQPEAWPEILEEISELEQENPHLLDCQFMAEWMTMFFVQAVRERRQSPLPITLQENKIREFLLRHPRPLIAGAQLCMILDNFSDPDLVIEKALRKLGDELTPVTAPDTPAKPKR